MRTQSERVSWKVPWTSFVLERRTTWRLVSSKCTLRWFAPFAGCAAFNCFLGYQSTSVCHSLSYLCVIKFWGSKLYTDCLGDVQLCPTRRSHSESRRLKIRFSLEFVRFTIYEPWKLYLCSCSQVNPRMASASVPICLVLLSLTWQRGSWLYPTCVWMDE